ncbi:MAG: hypothetical protein HY909_09750 [Deltaproteobacteria bacterium]|nr:hypothetical protein [Deltaproteobacteria bacterium]
MSVQRTVWVCVGLLACSCKRGPDMAVADEAAAAATRHVDRGRESVSTVSTGLLATLGRCAVPVGATLTTPVDPARVRNTLRDLHEERSPLGRELAFYPTRFLTLLGADGKAIASDRPPAEDVLPGRDLAGAFPCAAAALQGRAGTCVAEFSHREAEPPRVFFAAAQPARVAEGAPVTGALVGVISLASLARSIRTDLDVRTVSERVQLRVGFLVGDRVVPSGSDNTVPEAYLVPDTLVPRVPRDAWSKLQSLHGRFTFTFTENDGRFQWGAAIGTVPALGERVALVVFRSPLRQ